MIPLGSCVVVSVRPGDVRCGQVRWQWPEGSASIASVHQAGQQRCAASCRTLRGRRGKRHDGSARWGGGGEMQRGSQAKHDHQVPGSREALVRQGCARSHAIRHSVSTHPVRPSLASPAMVRKRMSESARESENDAGSWTATAKQARLSGPHVGSSTAAANLDAALCAQADGWPQLLRDIVKRVVGTGSPKGKEPLVLHTGFSGIGSVGEALSCLGISFHEECAIEQKKSAYKFVRDNCRQPHCWLTDVEATLRDGQCHCLVHDRVCKLPSAKRPDLLVSGFPCRPYSAIRPGSDVAEDRRNHPDFKKTRWALEHLRQLRPRAALFENVPNFTSGNTIAGTSHIKEFCQEARSIGYSVAWDLMDLAPWVGANSKRAYIWCIDSEMALPATDAKTLAKEFQAMRAHGGPPAPLSSCWISPMEVNMYHGSFVEVRPGPPQLEADGEGSNWKRQAPAARRAWAAKGRKDCHSQAWTTPAQGSPPLLHGLPQPVTNRQRELIDLGYLWSCCDLGLSPASAASRSRAAAGLIVDTSQNPDRHPWSRGLRRLCRASRPYIYELDRGMHPVEGFRAFGWRIVNLRSISSATAWDLVGDSMALQTLAVSLQALISAAKI